MVSTHHVLGGGETKSVRRVGDRARKSTLAFIGLSCSECVVHDIIKKKMLYAGVKVNR